MGRRKETKRTESPGKAPARPPAAKPEQAFDVWLDRGLHTLFDSVAGEPVPEELLRLIEEDRKK